MDPDEERRVARYRMLALVAITLALLITGTVLLVHLID